MRTLLLPFAFALAVVAHAQSPLAIAQKNAEAERKATISHDFAWFEKTETKDYVEIKKGGRKVNKAQSLAEMKASQNALKIDTLTAKVLGAKMVGKDLVSTVALKATGHVKAPDGKDHTFEFSGTTEETWTKVGGAWKMKIQKTLTEGGKIDGKSMP